MRTNAIIRIIIYSLLIAVLGSILTAGLLMENYSFGFDFDFSLDDSESGGNITSAGTVDPTQIRDIQIEWAAGSITIQPGDVDAITFAETEVSDDDYKMIWRQSGNRLTIQFRETSFDIFGITINDNLRKDLVITVPQDWTCSELEIDAAAVDISVSDLTITQVDFDGASGICSFNNCHVDEIKTDTASGDITFTGTLNVLDCETASADITAFLYNEPEQINLDMVSGNLDLTLPSDCGFRVNMDALSSDFATDFGGSYSGRDYVFGDESCSISINALSGDVTIRKAENESAGSAGAFIIKTLQLRTSRQKVRKEALFHSAGSVFPECRCEGPSLSQILLHVRQGRPQGLRSDLQTETASLPEPCAEWLHARFHRTGSQDHYLWPVPEQHCNLPKPKPLGFFHDRTVQRQTRRSSAIALAFSSAISHPAWTRSGWTERPRSRKHRVLLLSGSHAPVYPLWETPYTR